MQRCRHLDDLRGYLVHSAQNIQWVSVHMMQVIAGSNHSNNGLWMLNSLTHSLKSFSEGRYSLPILPLSLNYHRWVPLPSKANICTIRLWGPLTSKFGRACTNRLEMKPTIIDPSPNCKLKNVKSLEEMDVMKIICFEVSPKIEKEKPTQHRKD